MQAKGGKIGGIRLKTRALFPKQGSGVKILQPFSFATLEKKGVI